MGRKRGGWIFRIGPIIFALFMISGSLITDLIGIGGAVGLLLLARMTGPKTASL